MPQLYSILITVPQSHISICTLLAHFGSLLSSRFRLSFLRDDLFRFRILHIHIDMNDDQIYRESFCKELSGVSYEDMTRRATIPREGDDRREDRRGAVQTGGDGR